MEKRSSSNTHSPSFSVSNFIEFFLFHGILKWVEVIRIQNFCSSFQFLSQSQVLGKTKGLLDQWKKSSSFSELFSNYYLSFINKEVVVDDDGKISREDVELVMENLKISCDPNGDEKLQERLGKEISMLFEENEPSLEEVKEAFDVFDENKDGFVDARELQRVLKILGLEEESEMEDCKSMIRAFDENDDGRIDFTEFVKLMERSFC